MDNLPNTYHGKVVNGVIILENGAALPEGVAVKIELLEERLAPAAHNGQAPEERKAASSLDEMLLKYAGVADDHLRNAVC